MLACILVALWVCGGIGWLILRHRSGPWRRGVPETTIFQTGDIAVDPGFENWADASCPACVAAGFASAVYAWPGVFVLLKPSLFPFASAGVKRRSWWLAFGLSVLASLPFGRLWVDWVKAALIYPTDGGILYSLPYVPVICAPMVAWLGSSRCSLRAPALRALARSLRSDLGG